MGGIWIYDVTEYFMGEFNQGELNKYQQKTFFGNLSDQQAFMLQYSSILLLHLF